MQQEWIEILLQAALTKAQELNLPVTVSIVDMGGHWLALRRLEGASFFGVEISKKKAVTASQFKAPTHVLNDLGRKIPDLQSAFDKDDNVLTLAGGFPIVRDGKIIGGLGVSGGDFNQDKSVGEAAIGALSLLESV